MIEQLQNDFLFWIFIYALMVCLLIWNTHLIRRIKSIEKNKTHPAHEYTVLDIEQHMSNKHIGRLHTSKNRMVCIIQDGNRILRWDRSYVSHAKNHWQKVAPDSFEILGTIENLHYLGKQN